MLVKSKFLTAEWRKLIMANYAIDPAILKDHLPHKTELDSFEGKYYVSLVGFMFQDTRVLSVRVPFHTTFPEINLRFYARYQDGNKWKRGVVFIKEIVPRPAISFVANLVYKEKYVNLPVRHSIELGDDRFKIGYEWKFKKEWNRLEVKSHPKSVPLVNGSSEEFITEHFWGYSKVNHNTTAEYEVSHPRWEIYPVTESQISCNFGQLYGTEFKVLDSIKPDSVFLAEGSPITVYKKRLITS